MTATILLIRHAAHDHVGQVLTGRLPGFGLSAEGRRQVRQLASRLPRGSLDRLHTSPVQRARETAEAIAGEHPALEVEEHAALAEIDFGLWSGRSFAELDGDPHWDRWNRERGSCVPPEGEPMAAAQRRAWEHVAAAAARHPGETVAMVTHCDIIRAVAAQVLALPLDAVHRFDIDPASVSRLAVGDWGARVVSLNEGAA